MLYVTYLRSGSECINSWYVVAVILKLSHISKQWGWLKSLLTLLYSVCSVSVKSGCGVFRTSLLCSFFKSRSGHQVIWSKLCVIMLRGSHAVVSFHVFGNKVSGFHTQFSSGMWPQGKHKPYTAKGSVPMRGALVCLYASWAVTRTAILNWTFRFHCRAVVIGNHTYSKVKMRPVIFLNISLSRGFKWWLCWLMDCR